MAIAQAASADARLHQLAVGFEREARSCKIQGDGIATVLQGATALEEDLQEDGLASDVAQLRSARDAVQAWCGEVAATLELVKSDASYKAVEKELAEHTTKVAALRKTAKLAVDGAASLIRRLVPRINGRAGTMPARSPEVTPKVEAKVEAPKVEAKAEAPTPKEAKPEVQSDGPPTSVSVHAFTGGSCDDQARRVPHGERETWDREAPKRAAGSLGWLPGARWRLSYVEGERAVQIECVATKTGGYVITLERPDRELVDLAIRALAR